VKISFADFQEFKKSFPGHSGCSHETEDDVSIDVFIGRDDDWAWGPFLNVNPMGSFLTVKLESVLLKDTFECFPMEGG
jgi:hypothetical protein